MALTPQNRHLRLRTALAILSATAVLLCVFGCQTVSRSQPAFALIRIDSPEIVLGGGTSPSVGFTLVNTTTKQISGACLPTLEAKVADKWVVAWYPVFLGSCGLTLKPGETYREREPIFGFGLENNIDIRRRSESGDNLYRLSWKFAEGNGGTAKRARSVQAFSNAFRITVRRAHPVTSPGSEHRAT
jgi:hypothetical protein